MRRHHLWLLAAVLLIGLWAWTQPSRNGALHAPDAVPTATAPAGRSAFPATLPLPPIGPQAAATPTNPALDDYASYPDFLPREAHAVLDDIAGGGPYDYRQDGGVFQNRERRLPSQPPGYYREYTVETPGAGDRGPRRIVTGGGIGGGSLPREYWYSDDHYRSFRRFDVVGRQSR